MANTLLGQILPGMNSLKGIVGLIKAASNPMAAISQMAGNNPQMKQVMDYIRQSGGDERAAFYKLAEQKGVNPEEILSQVRQLMG